MYMQEPTTNIRYKNKMNPYQELNLPKDATEAEIKAAYRKQAQKNHPDKGGDQEQFQMVKAAYDVLSDPERRRRYDETGTTDKVKQPADIATEKLVVAFNQIISIEDFEGDIVKEVRRLFEGSQKQITAFLKKSAKELKRLGRLSGRVKTKKDNLCQMVIISKMNEINNAVKKAEQEQLVLDSIFKMLDDYEDDVPQPEFESYFGHISFT